MNSCVLMARVLGEPELRYTPDNRPLTQIIIEVPALREGNPASQLNAVGWGDNLSQEIQQNYHDGDQVIVTGRLSMNTIERPEGFKEKKAELIISKIQHLSTGLPPTESAGMPPAPMSNPVPAPMPISTVTPMAAPTPAVPAPPTTAPTTPEPNLDDIPF